MSNLTFTQKVAKIQKELKAPKNQFNKFGNYKYRNCEDILESVKPLLGDLVLTINDDVVEVGGRIYVKAIATITDGKEKLSNTAFARESSEQKGMNDSQITGAASSYARKYCLNGLFLIDDTKDADTEEFQGKKDSSSTVKVESKSEKSEPIESKEEKKETSKTPTKGGWGRKTDTPAKSVASEDLY